MTTLHASAVVLAAGGETDLACERLYRCHQRSLVAVARRRGCDEHEAWDVVQDVFFNLFRRGTLTKIATLGEDGQRAWLMRALKWTLGNQRRDQARLKRGRQHGHDSLEDLMESGMEIACHGTPATEHDRRWMVAVVERGLARLRADMKPAAWAGFESSLWGDAVCQTGGERVARHRAKRRLQELIRYESGELALYEAVSGKN